MQPVRLLFDFGWNWNRCKWVVRNQSLIQRYLLHEPVCLQMINKRYKVYLLVSKYWSYYSHSMVAGGFELMSYTTLFIPFTRLIIALDMSASNS